MFLAAVRPRFICNLIGNATVLNLWNALIDVLRLDYEEECTQFHDSHDKRRTLNDGLHEENRL